MKSKFVKLIPALAIIIGAIVISIFVFDVSAERVAFLMLFGTISTVLARLFIAYAKPSNWLFNQRFLLFGIVFLFFISVSTSLVQDQLDRIFHWSSLLVWIVLGISAGFYYKWKYSKTCKKTSFESVENEEMIQHDVAQYVTEGLLIKGRLILTNKRLLFIPVILGMPEFEFNLSDMNQKLEVEKFWGFPTRILLNAGSIKLNVVFPNLWKLRVNEQIALV